MDTRDKDRIVQRYNERLARFGDDPRTLASGPMDRRAQRYQVLRELGIESGASVLDIGCGFGDFFGWLQQQGVDVRYTGIDINRDLIEVAQRKYSAARFQQIDLQTRGLEQRFDYVVSSSAFNLKLESVDNYAFVEDMLGRAFRLAERGVAVDFLTSYVDFEGDGAFHYSPERVFSISKALTKRVCLRHDYPLFEFCVYLYPDFSGWSPSR